MVHSHILHRSRHTLKIYAVVGIETLILRRHQRVDEHWRNLVIFNRDTVLAIVTSEHLAVGTVDNRRFILFGVDYVI